MKKSDLTPEQLAELEQFGANTWFVEYLQELYNENPAELTEQWRLFFGKENGGKKERKLKSVDPRFREDYNKDKTVITEKTEFPESSVIPAPARLGGKSGIPETIVPSSNDELQFIVGSSARILDNMSSSLTIPVATSERAIPVKLLEENRTIINQQMKKRNLKISFTHIIGWAIVKALLKNTAMNFAFTISKGKPAVIRKKEINLGLAIDIQKKDRTHSLIVPNIRNAGSMSFTQFFNAYEDIVSRSRKGLIEPSEFQGTTISLTNPGTIGTVLSVPRLMIGQGTIIATGAIQYPAEYQAMSPSTISTLGISKVMNITSTYDHRIIQGAESGIFLKDIHEILLGADNFYEDIFKDLNIAAQPMHWMTDYQPGAFASNLNPEETEKQARVLQLINMYRVRGHLIAELDPLGTQSPYHPELDPAMYKFTMWDLDREFITGGFSGLKTARLRKILDILRNTYCGKIGVEFMHIQNPEEKVWLQNKMEPVQNVPQFDESMRKVILEKLITAELHEHFIHNRFVGHKRFSLEGSETLIPVLDLILNEACDEGILEIVLGMAHRGRLNVLANIIGKSYESIFSEFEDIPDQESIQGSGDVKYHLGATGKYKTRNGKSIKVSVASNPSHLEWVNPVVEGIVRAVQTKLGDQKDHKKIMPLLIHGDAAFAGQGIVAETLNLSQLSGYRTGGTVHIIINNQIGFTTLPEDARSSQYASDAAKMIQAPIFHVNGDDPESSMWAAKLAFEFRQTFHKDVVLDLYGYRRHGHNEGDEPGFTQPLLYEKIKNQPSVMSLYSDYLLKKKIFSESEIQSLKDEINNKLSAAFDTIKQKSTQHIIETPALVESDKIDSSKSTTETAVTHDQLDLVIERITAIPDNFNVHPKLKKLLENRRQFLEENVKADWAMAEALAFGTLLIEGNPVRLSGQDSVRGTFSQRHLSLTDMHSGAEYYPLNNISDDQAKLEALDSLLSEAAVLGFEYGYSSADPYALVLWEAQFGDFANGAQVIIDNFITVSYEKWQLKNSLVMLLPHGYETQGPEHSSARLERFLTLCAQDNIQVCNLTTPSQYFHALRRQIKSASRIPLILMTPKSMLRLPDARSYREEFISGKFMEVIDDKGVSKNDINRVLLTSGKVYYDLLKYRTEKKIENTAIVRVEQFYPYYSEKMKKLMSSYLNADKVIWVQEEPKNMGAWMFLSSRLIEDLTDKQKLTYSGRPESASPAVGSAKISAQQQKELVENSFTI